MCGRCDTQETRATYNTMVYIQYRKFLFRLFFRYSLEPLRLEGDRLGIDF